MSSVSLGHDASAERPLVSGTSILLFSAFLAGAVFGHALPPAAEFHAVTGAAAGVVAYIGLWYTTRVKEQREASRVNERVARKLERKLGKHLSPRRGLIAGMTRRVDRQSDS